MPARQRPSQSPKGEPRAAGLAPAGGATDFPPIHRGKHGRREGIRGDRQGAGVPAPLLCDHATNRVPASVAGGGLGVPPEEMGRHIAYDIGARGVTLELARLLHGPAVLTRFSRLVIDPTGARTIRRW